MLVSFSVSNFRSFSGEETFSLVASNRLTAHDEHLVPIPDSKERVLRAGVLYGANGAGKSNLFKALGYLQSVALKTRERGSGTGRTPFRFGKNADEPATFDLQFIADNKLYRFGVKLDDQRILEEWLVRVVGGREKTLYERVTDGHGKVTIEADGLKGAGEKLAALAKVGGPQNQSFLATIHATLDAADISDPLRGVITWFKDGLKLIGPDTPFKGLGATLDHHPGLLAFVGDFLRSASTGVDALRIVKHEVPEAELRSTLAEDDYKQFQVNLEERRDATTIVGQIGGGELTVEQQGKNRKYYRVGLQGLHNGHPLDVAEESDGTRRLLDLGPAQFLLKTETAVVFIDEIDRSLHPMLAWKFLEFFLNSSTRGQIIVTTHESNLLDLDLLRRDEIWFAEKDRSGATRLYSLADFNVRKDLEIRKHYLQGRFGAVPFLGDLDRLMKETGEPG